MPPSVIAREDADPYHAAAACPGKEKTVDGMAVASSGFQAIRGALAQPNYRYFAMGNVCSHMGTWIQRVAMSWLVWDITHSGSWLGIVAFADLFMTVLFAPFAGVVADRINRLTGIRVTQTLAMAQAATLWLLTLANLITIEWLLALAFANGIIMAFNQPLRFAIIPTLVDRKNLSSAIGINSLSFNFARVGGPAISGVIIAHVGASAAFLTNAISYAIFIAALYTLRLEAPPKRAPRPMREIPSEMLEGLRYCTLTPGVASMFVVLIVVAVCGRAYGELLPGFADKVFDFGVGGFSMLTSAAGAGAIGAGVLLATRSTVVGLMRVVTVNVFLLGAALVGLSPLGGMIAFTIGAGVGMGLLGERLSGRDVATGIVLALALGFGFLFLNLHATNAAQATTLLFGNVLAVSRAMLGSLVLLGLTTLVALAAISRPLLFASLQPELAEARGVPVRLTATLFMVIVALAVAQSVQIVGVLLVFALMVGPPAAAQLLTARLLPGVLVAGGLAVLQAWLGIAIAFQTDWPTSFCITALGALILEQPYRQRRRE